MCIVVVDGGGWFSLRYTIIACSAGRAWHKKNTTFFLCIMDRFSLAMLLRLSIAFIFLFEFSCTAIAILFNIFLQNMDFSIFSNVFKWIYFIFLHRIPATFANAKLYIGIMNTEHIEGKTHICCFEQFFFVVFCSSLCKRRVTFVYE